MLSNRENEAFVTLATKSLSIMSIKAFEDWCRTDLRQFMDFGMLICTTGRTFGNLVVIDNMYGIDYPSEYMHHIQRKAHMDERKVINTWLTTRQPQLIDRNNYTAALSALEIEEYEYFALENIAAHGVVEPDGSRASYFSFSRLPENEMNVAKFKLALLAPYLHQLYSVLSWVKLKQRNEIHKGSNLTPKELEVLRWVLEGKSNPQIAAALGRSANTVKHQVASVLQKLGADSRAQAAAIAVEMGIFPIGGVDG